MTSFNSFIQSLAIAYIIHWGKADDRNCNYGHPKMAGMKLGKNLFCRLNCFYDVFLNDTCTSTIVIL